MYTPINHDVWNRRALGPYAREVYEALLRSREAKSKVTFIRETGLASKTVTRTLEGLVDTGLAFREEPFWAGNQVDVDRLDELAMQLGTKGKLTEKKARHKGEIERYAVIQLFGGSKKGNPGDLRP